MKNRIVVLFIFLAVLVIIFIFAAKRAVKGCKSLNINDLTYQNGDFQQIGDRFQLGPKSSSENLSNVFPVAYYPSCNLETGKVRVEFKIISGKEDKYAGLVFGLTSEGNYYVVRASASENSVTIAQFRNGNRTVLKTYDSKVTDHEWHTLLVTIQNDKVSVNFDSNLVTDNYPLKTITGKVGVNTKSDSVTQFKNLNIN